MDGCTQLLVHGWVYTVVSAWMGVHCCVYVLLLCAHDHVWDHVSAGSETLHVVNV